MPPPDLPVELWDLSQSDLGDDRGEDSVLHAIAEVSQGVENECAKATSSVSAEGRSESKVTSKQSAWASFLAAGRGLMALGDIRRHLGLESESWTKAPAGHWQRAAATTPVKTKHRGFLFTMRHLAVIQTVLIPWPTFPLTSIRASH